MTLRDHQRAQELLEQYDALEPQRQQVQELLEAAEEEPYLYTEADEARADVNESLADLADEAMEILRRVTFR